MINTIQSYARPLSAFIADHGISRRCFWEVCKGAAAVSPITDLVESVNRATEGVMRSVASGKIDRYPIIVFTGTNLMTHYAIKIFNRVVFPEGENNYTVLAADLAGSTAMFFVAWAIATCQKSMARGLKHYKALIEKESLDSKTAKEGTALIFDPAWDHNGAFDCDFSQATNYEQLGKRFKLVSHTTGLTPKLFHAIHHCADQGDDIKVLELQGHGHPYWTELSKSETKPEDREDYFIPNNLYGYEPELEAALDRLNPHAVILIHSCSASGKTPVNNCLTPNWQSKNTAHRIAALANRRKVIASNDDSNWFIMRNDPTSPDQGLKIKILDGFRQDLTEHIQENDQNTHEFEEIRSAIYAARAHNDIEQAVLKLKEKEGYKKSDPIRLSVNCSEKIKKYINYNLLGVLTNRVGVKSVDYGENPPEAEAYQILGESATFSIL